MTNSKIADLTLLDTLNTSRLRFNQLLDSVGDVSTLTTTNKDSGVVGAINELDSEMGPINAVTMGTKAHTVSGAIAELDGRLDSINNTELLSPRMTLRDSSALNTIRGNLNTDGTLNVGTNLDVAGLTTLDSTTIDNSLLVNNLMTVVGKPVFTNNAAGDSATFSGHVGIDSNLRVGGNTAISGNTVLTGTLDVGNHSPAVTNINNALVVDSNLTVHGVSNVDSVNVIGKVDVTGELIVSKGFTVGGVFTTTGPTRNAASHALQLDGITVSNSNRGGLAIDRPSADSAVIQWNEQEDYWEAGTTSTDGGGGTDNLKRLALQNDSATFTNLYQPDNTVLGGISTGATRVPAGTTAQRPTAVQGQIRYNTTTSNFEGYTGSVWDPLKSVIDDDRDTKIIAEINSGADSDTLQFITAGTQRATINSDKFDMNVALSVNDSAYIVGNLAVGGNLEIRGTTTTVDTTNLVVEDNIIVLNSNATGTPSNILRAGIEVERGDEANVFLQWNENGDYFEATDGSNLSRILSTGAISVLDPLNFDSATMVFTHNNVSRSDSSSTASPGFAGTFDVVNAVTANEKGHVTSVSTKTISMPTQPTYSGDSISIDTGALSLAQVFESISITLQTNTLGHVTGATGSVSNRTLTLADIGYTGDADANKYILPAATASVLGGIELADNTVQSTAAQAVTNTTNRTYGLQVNAAGQGVINVPWTAQDTTFKVQDGDGTEVTIGNDKYLKFVENGGINVNFTDTSNGTSGDPFDLSFNVSCTESLTVANSAGSALKTIHGFSTSSG